MTVHKINDATTYGLRPLTLGDWVDLRVHCWPNASVEALSYFVSDIVEKMGQERVHGLVATVDRLGQLPIAYGQLTRWPNTAEISDLIVAPEWRGQGIGSALIGQLTEVARVWQLPKVEIGAALRNGRAMALYQRLGFSEARRLELDLGDGAEMVIYLEKTLG